MDSGIERGAMTLDALRTVAPIKALWPDPLDLEVLSEREPLRPRFIADDWLPCGYASLLAGHGGVGKSGIALHLAVCIGLGIPFFGVPVDRRMVLYLSCEDRENILHWRLTRICNYLGVDMSDLRGWLDVIDLVGRDTILWSRDPYTGNAVTPAFVELERRIKSSERQVIFVDGISDTYGGNENDKAQVKQYVNLLLGTVPPDDGAVLLIGHVAKPTAAGIATTEGYSGTTGWHNAVRARWYLHPEVRSGEDGTSERTGDLVLELQKSNLGRTEQSIKFRWDDDVHLFVGQVEPKETNFDREHRKRMERDGILAALEASIAAGVQVPAAVQGQRTGYHVLSARTEFPTSLRGNVSCRRRFNRLVEEMRQAGTVSTEMITRPHRRPTEALVLPIERGNRE